MVDSNWTHRDELVDILLDLKHDLGKYLFLHLSHLTVDSPADMVTEALTEALFETRKIGGKVQTAEQIWLRYKQEIDALGYSFAGYPQLVAHVEAALDMKRFLESPSTQYAPHVGQIQKIAKQVVEIISQCIAEENGDQ